MRHQDFVATTFTYKRDSQWMFKHVISYKRKMIRDVTCSMVDRFIEDYQDERIEEKIPSILEEASKTGYVEWNVFKRRTGLDSIQSHGKP